MPFAMALGCLSAGMSLEEAINATTVNAAFALDRWSEVGSLEEGKKMDAVILVDADPACLLQVGTATVDTVIKNGEVVVESGRIKRETVRKRAGSSPMGAKPAP